MSLKNKKTINRKYLDWVKQQTSAISFMPADDPHHIIGHGQGGTAVTASDLFAFPLTRREHTELHDVGYLRWELRWGSQWKYVANTLKKAVERGVLTIDVIEREIDEQVISCDDRAYFMQELGIDIEVDHVV